MRQIFFIIILVICYQWLVENGYADNFLDAIGNFDPQAFIDFLHTLAAKLGDLAKETFENFKK